MIAINMLWSKLVNAYISIFKYHAIQHVIRCLTKMEHVIECLTMFPIKPNYRERTKFHTKWRTNVWYNDWMREAATLFIFNQITSSGCHPQSKKIRPKHGPQIIPNKSLRIVKSICLWVPLSVINIPLFQVH